MKVLVVEDDRDLAGQIAAALAQAGYTVELAHDGEEGEFLGATETVGAAVLDLGLPGIDGIEVLRRWRGAGLSFPVLILTARDAWSDKVAGFRAGADDYVLKPFRMEEVTLRLSSLIRRAAGHATAELAAGGLVLDTATGLATLEGMPLRLTAFEARLLRYLMLNKGRVVSRTELSEHMYDRDADRDFRSLEVVIGRLRKKIGEARVETRRGEGYRLLPGDPA
ncbi:response regulator transcription factor (plasmid) [Cereibacter azotoformans]|uniref:Winged helix family two component transcriptional regulator n=4 Tax=Cereibacter TaxID=1653176 RepID=A0A2T5JIM7_9RHOB|nr:MULTISPECIES: response regulator transcription factor [Cereibacter]AXQ96253.1 DNA-binding response regulator [Cereibacter sphaeroides]PTR05884.1 winged helix family two component transcriptional regulator [Cereibacter azotoformans]UIJ32893.1 response regulator transcription factor [Cereibacter azotoformans]UIJ33189.1 response regulator transcription factor [Cereibacter azotoformans]ULB12140.1 response regulator transcription factor [Cereibacter azotoformans]